MMNSDIICKESLNNRKNCTANNCRTKNSGSLTGMFAKPVNCKCENCREHNRIEKTDCKNGPHCYLTKSQHRYYNENGGNKRVKCKNFSRINFSLNGRTDKSSNHCTTPIKGYKFTCIGFL